MMATYYVDDGGDGTTENSWATADTSINNLDAEYTLASGDIVYFGHDMQCQAVNSGTLTISGPSSGAPVKFISATQGSSPPTYQASSTNQIDTSEGSFDMGFYGSFALYGMCINGGNNIQFNQDTDETASAFGTTFKLGATGSLYFTSSSTQRYLLKNCTVDCSASVSAQTAAPVQLSTAVFQNAATVDFINVSFTNCQNRCGPVVFVIGGGWGINASGCDFSSVTYSTPPAIINPTSAKSAVFNNCITAATWTPIGSGYTLLGAELMFSNCGPADAPTYMVTRTCLGGIVSSSSIYRSGGASIEGESCAWLVTTSNSNPAVSEAMPFTSPWIYGVIASTGSKTFDLYITNDTADFTDAEVWIDVEYLATADEAQTALASDWRHYPTGSTYITTTAAAQTDDTTSTWSGTGPSFTYKQKLSVTATVNETGQFRARVCVGVANITSSRYFYIDPKVEVT